MEIAQYIKEHPFGFEIMRADSGMRRWLQWKPVPSGQGGQQPFRNAEAFKMLKIAGASMCAYDESVKKYIIGWDNGFEIKLDHTNALRFVFMYRPKPVFCFVETTPVGKGISLLLCQLMGSNASRGTD